MSTLEELQIEYNKLKEEFDEHKIIAGEYEKELEETNKAFETRNGELTIENEKLYKEVNKSKEEAIQLKQKNLERMTEIQYLETQIDKLKKMNEALSNEKSNLEKKIVELENDNTDYLNKLREIECLSEDLKTKLDAALEENIILHNESEANKNELEENLQRIKQELEEAKNEILSKETIINRMTVHRDFILKNAYNINEDIDDPTIQNLKNNQGIKMVTPVNDESLIPEKFMQNYSKTFLNVKNEEDEDSYDENRERTLKKNPNNLKSEGDDTNTGVNLGELLLDESYEELYDEKEKEKTFNVTNKQIEEVNSKRQISTKGLEKFINTENLEKEQNIIADKEIKEDIKEDIKDLKSSLTLTEGVRAEEEDDKEFIRQRIDLEVKTILENRKNFLLNTLTHENFSFDFVSSPSHNEIKIKPNQKEITSLSHNKNKKLINNIDDMLSKIKERKEKVLLQKKTLQNKLEKIGVRMF